MADSYTPEYPSTIVIDPEICYFFEQFYRITDINTPQAHAEYVNNFTKDAVFIMASKFVRGHKEIMTAREGMWLNISKRLHKPLKVFPFGPDATEFMLCGTVAYELYDGRKTVVEWAAQAGLVKEGKVWKFRLYQVYLDPTAWQSAK